MKPRLLPRPMARALSHATGTPTAGIGPHQQITYTKVGQNRGTPRLWLEGLRLERCGFTPGTRFRVELDLVSRQVRLKVDPAGDRTVSQRQRSTGDGEGKATPIVDVTGGSLAEVLGEGARVRAVLSGGEIVFDLHPTELAIEAREKRTREHLAQGCLTEATLCAGAGVATLALKEGLEREGLSTRVDWIIDRAGEYLDLAARNNPAITSETRLYEASLEELDVKALSSADVLQVSLPCTGHGRSGRAKRQLTVAEEHPTDALAVYGLLRILEAVNPSIVVSENVELARDSASYMLVRAYLQEQGYVISEAILDARQAGTIEDRRRWWFCAISRGLAEGYSMADLPPQPRLYATLGDALEAISDDDSRWRSYGYLAEKAARDAAAGKGFKRQLVVPESDQIPTLRRLYWKGGTTDPFLDREDGKQRLLTPVEHARVKGIPEQLVDGACATLAHEALGQSILYGHAVGIGQSLGAHLRTFVATAREIEHGAPVAHDEDEPYEGMKP